MSAECMICGKPISTRFFACETCERAYPDLKRPFAEWPDWARYLKREEQRRRFRATHEVQEISASDLPAFDRLLYGE